MFLEQMLIEQTAREKKDIRIYVVWTNGIAPLPEVLRRVFVLVFLSSAIKEKGRHNTHMVK